MIPWCFFSEEICFDFFERLEQKKSFVYIPNTMNKSIPIHLCIQKESICAMTKSYHEQWVQDLRRTSQPNALGLEEISVSSFNIQNKAKGPWFIEKNGIFNINLFKSNQLKKEKGGSPPQLTSTPTNALRCPSLCHVSFLLGRQQQLHHLSSMVLTGLEVVHLQDRKYTLSIYRTHPRLLRGTLS